MNEQNQMNRSEEESAANTNRNTDEDMSSETSMGYKCSVCGLIYSSQESLNDHYKINHNMENPTKQNQSPENTPKQWNENVENTKNGNEESESKSEWSETDTEDKKMEMKSEDNEKGKSEWTANDNENTEMNNVESEGKDQDTMSSEKYWPENKVTLESEAEENQMHKSESSEPSIGSDQMKEQFECKIDGERFSNQIDLDQHMKTVHSQNYSKEQEAENSMPM